MRTIELLEGTADIGRLRLYATALALAALTAICPVRAATFTVTTLAEGGAGSLRQAILDANGLAGVDTIDFQPGLVGTIELASGLPQITESLDILGPGFDLLTVDANGHDRVLDFDGSNGDNFTVEELTLTGGLVDDSSGGGGIRLSANQELTLDAVHVRGNRVEGPSDDAGGGLYAALGATLVVRRSLVDGNEAGRGGGIFGGDITIENSTISRNRASTEGGGVWCNGMLGLFESTVTGNVAESDTSISFGGGLNLQDGGELLVFQSTITDNVASIGPGIRVWAGASVTDVGGTVVAGNRFTNGSEGNCGADLGITDRHNLSSDASCGFVGASDLQNTDPELFALAQNGGPTPTQVPAPSSPLIESGNNSLCLAFDQRGLPRPVDGDGDGDAICDIGAVEYRPGVDDPIHVDGFESGDTSGWSSSLP